MSLVIVLLMAMLCLTRVSGQNNIEKDWVFKNSKSLSELWELDDEHHRGTFLISSYKPIYFTLGKFSTDTNKDPQSENLENSLPEPMDLDPIEAKFQVSLKTKIFHNVFWGKGDLWAAYTQKAFWQIYNKKESRPFRELNYEPELILNFPVDFSILGFTGKMVGVALVHESNGQSDPVSRSWNRMVFHVGFERNDWQVMFKPWFRLGNKIDDNPDISDFVGRGELSLTYDWGQQRFSAIGRHSLRFGDKSRGSLLFSWSFPIVKNFSGHVQVFEGYGESLIDYNHRQTTVGLGVSLIN
ncbi:phospholipase A [Pareuzebyella sediminis]|uniref:phospholipase A n=1 Tax=Pareuzebyella sediminis TaxID=2607998 RepID=UPI001E35E521|nr:phospholipase A [Pareuzebyella sediminis]